MTTERSIQEKSLTDDLRLEENLAESTIPASLFSGIKLRGKETNDLLMSAPTIENFSQYSAAIRDYFFHIEKNHKSFALLLGKMLNDKRNSNMEKLLVEIEHLKNPSPNEVLTKIANAELGEPDSEMRKLLSSLKNLYTINNSVLERFKKQVEDQNEIYKYLSDNKKKHEKFGTTKNDIIFSFIEEEEISKSDASKMAKKEFSESDANKMIKNIYDSIGKSLMDDDFSSDEYMRQFTTNMSLDPQNSEDKQILKDLLETKKRAIENIIDTDVLQKKHEDAALCARIFTIKTFQTNESAAELTTLFYQRGSSDDEVRKNIISLQESIQQSITSIKLANPNVASFFSGETISAITKELTDKYIKAAKKEDKELIDAIDNKSNEISVKTKIIPDLKLEEIFMRTVEDTVYNVMMAKKGKDNTSALELYNKISEGTKPRLEQAVDINENVRSGKYEPISQGTKSYSLASDAISLLNLRTVAKSIGEESISKEMARKGINNAINTLNIPKEEKDIFANELMSKFNRPHLLKDIDKSLERSDIDRKTGDLTMNYNAKKLYAQQFSPLLFKDARTRIMSRRTLALQSCLDSASAPKISSHSSSGEVSQCFEQFKKQLKEDVDALRRTSAEPIAALTGLSFIAMIATAWTEGRLHNISMELHKMEKERIQAIDFINTAETTTDKHFRANAIKNDKFFISEEIVSKKDIDEWIFRSVVAKHDLEIYHDSGLKATVSDIKNSGNMNERAEVLRDSINATLNHHDIRDSFMDFSEQEQSRIYNNYQKDFRTFVLKSKLLEEALLEKNPALAEEGAAAYMDYLKNLEKAYQSGAIPLTDVRKDIDVFSDKMNATLKAMNTHLKSIDKEMEAKQEALKSLTGEEATLLNINKRNTIEKEISDFAEDMKNTRDVMSKIQQTSSSAEAFTSSFTFQKELYENKDIYSQRAAFGDDNDVEKSIRALIGRYSNPKIINNSISQDLILLENFQAHLKEESKKGIKHSPEQIRAVDSIKVMMREYYVASQLEKSKGNVSETDIMRDLYEAKKEMFTSTAEVDFTLVEQSDKTKSQIVTMEKYGKNSPREEIKDPIERAMDTIKEHHNANAFGDENSYNLKKKKSTGNEEEMDILSAYKLIAQATGVEISKNEHKNEGLKDGLLSEKTQKNINNDSTKFVYAQRL